MTRIYKEGGRLKAVRIRRFSNFHGHLRQGAIMQAVAPVLLRYVHYFLVMPNTSPPAATMEQALAYHAELMQVAQKHNCIHLKALIMTLYHTAQTTPALIEQVAKSDIVRAVKHYPPHPGATTGSGHGIPLSQSTKMLRAMEETGVPLLGHFESVVDKHGNALPPTEREEYFITNHLWALRDKFPKLRMCFEHASTAAAVRFVKSDPSGNTVLTATPQHTLFTTPDLKGYSWGNHLKCMPIVKKASDRDAVLRFVTSGDPRAIMGDDTAPHLKSKKDLPFDDCPNGCYLPHGPALYAKAFETAGALDDRFEKFMSLNGPAWWRLPPPEEGDEVTIVVHKDGMPEPTLVPEEHDCIVPLGRAEPGHDDQYPVGFMVA